MPNSQIYYFSDPEKFSSENEQNCLRFFALQDVSRKAMKMKIDTMFQNFETMWTSFETYCTKTRKRASKLRSLVIVSITTFTNKHFLRQNIYVRSFLWTLFGVTMAHIIDN